MSDDRCRRMGGFTLIELMIVVLIVSILAAIAYPSYEEHVRKARRADAEAVLLQLAMVMERVYTEEDTYTPRNSGTEYPQLGSGGVFPDKSPIDGDDKFYELIITDPDSDVSTENYLLTARPVNQQAGDKCGNLTLRDTGVKGLDGEDDDVDVEDCW